MASEFRELAAIKTTSGMYGGMMGCIRVDMTHVDLQNAEWWSLVLRVFGSAFQLIIK